MSFTDETEQIATEHDCKLPWMGGAKGKYFRCALCGHKFEPGDKWRFVFTNNLPGASGNPLVCETCYGSATEARAKWQAKCAEWNSGFWWWFRRGERNAD